MIINLPFKGLVRANKNHISQILEKSLTWGPKNKYHCWKYFQARSCDQFLKKLNLKVLLKSTYCEKKIDKNKKQKLQSGLEWSLCTKLNDQHEIEIIKSTDLEPVWVNLLKYRAFWPSIYE